MIPTYDVVIVGGGIIGAACALECARSGLHTAVVEANTIAGGTTAAGMGHVLLMDDSPERLALTRYARQLWDELAPELPGTVEFQRCGTIWIASNEHEMEAVAAKHAFLRSQNVASEVLDAHALTEAEPNLSSTLAGALFVPGDRVLHPPVATQFLIERAKQLGTIVYIGSAATAIAGHSMHLANGVTLSTGTTVNAAGVWSPSLTPGITIKKRKGHLLITAPYPNYIRHQLVELSYIKSAHASAIDSVAFNVQPRANGQIVIGSSRQYDDESNAVDEAMLNQMLARAREFLPNLDTLTRVHAWTGFRPATLDKLPLIGPAGDENLYLATGHEGLGITTALATARLLVDGILSRPSAIPREPYLPSRVQGAAS